MFITSILLVLCLALLAIYCVWQLRLNHSFSKQMPRFSPGQGNTPRVAVIVPFRNEEKHLRSLLDSLLIQQNLICNFKIILINDHSTDKSVTIVEAVIERQQGLREGAAAGARDFMEGQGSATNWAGENKVPQIKLLHLADHLAGRQVIAHKKEALAYGISQTTADIILTTDADCQLPPNCLQAVTEAFQPDVQVVCGPVWIAPARNFCDRFQELDLAAYQFLTACSIKRGTPTLANGAFFAFRKSAFATVGGYGGVNHLPSGDDVLLLHKFRAHLPPAAFAWLDTGPVVSTRPVDDWRALWRQRLRWAGKAGHYQADELRFAQAISFLTCLALIALIPISLHLRAVALVPICWSAKILVDYLNLRALYRQYQKPFPGLSYLGTALLYPFFLVAVGSAALLGYKAGWKGRGV